MSNKKCGNCENYKEQGHNYCRMCGYHLTKGNAPHTRLSTAYNTNEKFCGYCGGIKNKCTCV